MVFSLTYGFTYQQNTYTGKDTVVINADHVEYAHGGLLYTTPQLAFTMEDINKVLHSGTPIKVHCVPMMPWIHHPEYDPIVYQAARL